jgi:hypothetical protein
LPINHLTNFGESGLGNKKARLNLFSLAFLL